MNEDTTQEVKLEPFIETYTGKKFYFLNPTPDTIDIIDIAHSLAMQCRYTGHTSRFYSVAEHSVIVSMLVPEELALEALLHDASEAYLADVAGPLKPHLTGYRDMENVVMGAIAKHFGFNWPVHPFVHEADKVQLVSEATHLLATQGKDWVHLYKKEGRTGKVPRGFSPEHAKALFLDRFIEVTGATKEYAPQLVLAI